MTREEDLNRINITGSSKCFVIKEATGVGKRNLFHRLIATKPYRNISASQSALCAGRRGECTSAVAMLLEASNRLNWRSRGTGEFLMRKNRGQNSLPRTQMGGQQGGEVDRRM